jgi:hypothetical protein
VCAIWLISRYFERFFECVSIPVSSTGYLNNSKTLQTRHRHVPLLCRELSGC